jgi:hypothetical protein
MSENVAVRNPFIHRVEVVLTFLLKDVFFLGDADPK